MLPIALLTLALLLSVQRGALAQDRGDGAQAPALSGSIEIGLHEGLIAAALCLRPVARQADTVRFVLHRGMNVKRIHDGAGRELHLVSRPVMQTDADELLYTVLDSAVAGASEGRSLCVEYRGAFPVYDVAHADYRSSDGSDVIAFNGQTLRARGESRWYPAPYDPATHAAVGALGFDIRVRCAACQRLYVNGSTPQAGPEAKLLSTAAVEPFLFVGNYPDSEKGGMRFLGEAVSTDTAASFAARIGEITRYYEQTLEVPWGSRVVVVRVVPVRRDRRGQLWGFLADPALGLAGLTIGDFVQILSDTAAGPARPLVLGVLAHELAHRFFPWRMRPTAEEFQFFSEPFAVYLDLQATRHFLGDSAYGARLAGLRRRVADSDSLPLLSKATPKDLAADPYRYAYVPLLLVALERQVGEARMRALLRALLTSPATKAVGPIARLHDAARQAHVTDAQWENWESECVDVSARRASCVR